MCIRDRNGWMLADSVMSWFHNASNITFDVSTEYYKYVHFGVNLLGFTHGDGCKEKELPDLMKTQAREAWAKSRYGYWYVHHIHHKDRGGYIGQKKQMKEKDHRDVMVIQDGQMRPNSVHVEYVRTLKGEDEWHAKKGYIEQPLSLECYLHSLRHGQTDRIGVFY